MRTTITLDDKVLAEAARLVGKSDTGTLVRLGLDALIARESARRLIALGGTDPDAEAAPRRPAS
ncbi:MAG: type II toxin-antitoxin system VapB family antitoxin [Microlunatus sp.]